MTEKDRNVLLASDYATVAHQHGQEIQQSRRTRLYYVPYLDQRQAQCHFNTLDEARAAVTRCINDIIRKNLEKS